jgi:hypothetical protein
MDYLYYGDINFSAQVAHELLILANKYRLARLTDVCAKLLKKTVTKQNIVELIALADKHNAISLKDNCFEQIISIWPEFLTSKDILRLPKKRIIELMIYGLRRK